MFVPDPESRDRRFFAKPPERPRSHHLHLCSAGSDCEVRHLAVRDFLRSHPDVAAQYEGLKRELVRRHSQDRLAYITGKDRYVKELEARALATSRSGASPAG
jgi:GrpB-like predicted nucleotidyltransferase (UPF0157 family)